MRPRDVAIAAANPSHRAGRPRPLPYKRRMRHPRLLLLAALCAACSASPRASSTAPVAAPAAEVRADVRAALDAPDRTAADRALDPQRRPGEVVTFFRIERGQRVADLFAGGGYTSEVLARVVGPDGRVFSQNNRFAIDRFANAPWTARLATPAMRNVVRVEREFDDPLPPEATDLDAVLSVLVYHDSVWLNADRAAMNRAVFRALRAGGVYGIIDHSAAEGHGTADAQTLHRIEERVVVEEVTAAGFRLDARSDLLRNPADPRDWNSSPREAGARRGQSDRFMLRFVKP